MYLKRFDDFNNGIEVFRKMQSGKMKLEEVKNLQNVFNSNLNEISRERYKSEEQKLTLANIKLLNESQEFFINLFNDYSSIVSAPKYKTIQQKRIPSMLAGVARG